MNATLSDGLTVLPRLVLPDGTYIIDMKLRKFRHSCKPWLAKQTSLFCVGCGMPLD